MKYLNLKVALAFLMSMSTFIGVWAQGASNTGTTPRDRAYDVIRTNERKVITYEHLREADVFWEKRIWRVIDVNEKMNHIFTYPKRQFIQILLDNAYSGDLPAYNPQDDEFTVIMTPDEVKSIGSGVDTQLVIDPITLEERYEIVIQELDIEKITKFRIKEDWIFDKQTSILWPRILGICPIESRYDESGNFIGDFPMFWVYYPTLRNFLVNEETFNPLNNSNRISWDDIFEMRLFTSYIIKESNVYDRRIKDYYTGIDQLLEHDKIRQEMFEWEHDLWSF